MSKKDVKRHEKRDAVCMTCNGKKKHPLHRSLPCPRCKGTGVEDYCATCDWYLKGLPECPLQDKNT